MSAIVPKFSLGTANRRFLRAGTFSLAAALVLLPAVKAGVTGSQSLLSAAFATSSAGKKAVTSFNWPVLIYQNNSPAMMSLSQVSSFSGAVGSQDNQAVLYAGATVSGGTLGGNITGFDIQATNPLTGVSISIISIFSSIQILYEGDSMTAVFATPELSSELIANALLALGGTVKIDAIVTTYGGSVIVDSYNLVADNSDPAGKILLQQKLELGSSGQVTGGSVNYLGGPVSPSGGQPSDEERLYLVFSSFESNEDGSITGTIGDKDCLPQAAQMCPSYKYQIGDQITIWP